MHVRYLCVAGLIAASLCLSAGTGCLWFLAQRAADSGDTADDGDGGGSSLPIATPTQPPQATSGPGSSASRSTSYTSARYGSGAQEYFLYQPANPTPAQAQVVVFLHGYGGINPRAYGGWINHLVRRGYVVVFPVYQTSLAGAAEYTSNALAAIQDAFGRLGLGGNVAADPNGFAIVGHSLGGVIAFNVANAAVSRGLPRPRVILAVNAGDSNASSDSIASIQAGSYASIPSDALVLFVVGEDDQIAGEKASREIYGKLGQIPTSRRELLLLRSDSYGEPDVSASHLAPLSRDDRFDSGESLLAGGSVQNADLQRQTLDVLDYNGYWKFLDGLIDAAFVGTNQEYALGGTALQTSLGSWSDGTPITPAEVLLP